MTDQTLSAEGVKVGDTMQVVVVHPNVDDDREPAAKYLDRTLYITTDGEDWEPELGEMVKVRVANIKENTMRGVKL